MNLVKKYTIMNAMTAKEARERAAEVNFSFNLANYEDVIENINEEVEKGEYFIEYYGHLRPDSVNKLEKLGYKLSRDQSGPNEWCWTIKW